jgi:hypothetical protein
MAPPRLTPTHSSEFGGWPAGWGLGWVLPKSGCWWRSATSLVIDLVMVTRESAKLDTRFLPELMLTVNKNSNKLSAFLPILALGFVLGPPLAGIVEPTSVSCGC